MIGIILKNVRIDKGYTQKELGKIMSLADTTISSYERGNSQPDFETIVKILRECDYDILIKDINLDKYKTVEEMSREK